MGEQLWLELSGHCHKGGHGPQSQCLHSPWGTAPHSQMLASLPTPLTQRKEDQRDSGHPISPTVLSLSQGKSAVWLFMEGHTSKVVSGNYAGVGFFPAEGRLTMESTHSDTVWSGLYPQGPLARHTGPRLRTWRQEGDVGSELRLSCSSTATASVSLRGVTPVIPAPCGDSDTAVCRKRS